jgi:hypothetical protein
MKKEANDMLKRLGKIVKEPYIRVHEQDNDGNLTVLSFQRADFTKDKVKEIFEHLKNSKENLIKELENSRKHDDLIKKDIESLDINMNDLKPFYNRVMELLSKTEEK